MRRILLTICSLLCITASQAQTTTTIGSGTNVYNTGVTVNIPFGSFVNNGTYYDTTSPGQMQFDGGVNYSGSGTTSVWDLHFINGGTSTLTSMVSVYHTATIDAGCTVNAGSSPNNINLRTDLPGHANASLVVNGILNGTISGLVTNATATTACGSYSSTLSTNISGSVIKYQWESSPNNVTYTAISGATNSTYTTTVTSGVWYHVLISTTNTAFTATTAPVQLNFFTAPTAISGTNIICNGNTSFLVTTSSGGVWSSSNTGVATVGSNTGVITGVGTGSAVMTYTMPGPSCFRTYEVGVNPLPTVSSTSGNVVCSGTNSSVSATPAAGSSINWYGSSGGGGSLGTGNTLSVIAPTVTTTYYAEAVDNNLSPLSTIFSGLTTEPGVMFDVTMLKSVTLSSFDMRCNVGTFNVEIYYKTGTLVGSENNPAAWTLITTIPSSSSGSVGNRNFPLSTPLNLYGGQTYSFYVTGTIPGGGEVIYSIGTAVGNIAASNADLQIKEGVAKDYPFTTTFSPRVANVSLNYSKPSCSSSPRATAVLTVNPNPATPAGTASVCIGSTTTLSSATTGGTWTSGSANATVGSATGIVTGVTAGSANITYTLPTGCFSFVTVTVNSNPAAIGGTFAVCAGSTTLLTDATSGGTWSSSNTSQATIGTSGTVTGVAAGNPFITYTLPTGCIATQQITVNPLPAAISGSLAVCAGSTTTLTDATTGGTWTSGTPGTATIGAASGIVTTVSAGPATTLITYTLPTGCLVTATLTVNPVPNAITGTLSVCAGLTTTVSATPAGGTWSSSDLTMATVGSATGVVTGVAAGNPIVTYMLATGCVSTATLTVNPTPVSITGTNVVCVGSTTTLSNGTSGGTWSTSNPAVGTVGASSGIVGGIGAGTATIIYTLPAGCTATIPLTVNALPGAFGGATNVCEGLTATVTNATGGGTWTSSNPTSASIGSATGIVTGIVAGTVNLTYTLPTGCLATMPFTVNPTPAAISGSSSVCTGSTITLSDATTGGIWTSSNANATVGSASGIVTGATPGASVITYTLPAGCTATKSITINATPNAITGATAVCVGLTTTLSSTTSGGIWSSNNPASATVGSTTGVVTGIAAGSPTISYTVPNGCFVVNPMTVNPTPAPISGTTTVCVNSTVSLTDITGGGVWTSSNIAQATVGSSTGIVTGVAAGNPTITYTLAGGCTATTPITVNAVPNITNFTSPTALNPCLGNAATVNVNSTTLGASTFTVTYNISGANSSTGNTASVTMGASTGPFVVPNTLLTNSGVTTVTINAITNTLGCTSFPASSNAVTVTVNPLPTAYTVMGTGSYCAGGAGIHVFISNSVGGVSYQLFLGGSPVGSPINGIFAALDMGAQTAAGTYTVVGTNSTTGCVNNMVGSAIISINPLPTAFAVTGGGSYCAGGTGVTVGLANSTSGVSYQLMLAGSPSGSAVSGTGGAISFGLRTLAGTYTVIATNTTTTCTNTMTGSATVTINPLPAAITGTTSVCPGTSTTLASTSAGGTWTSVNTAVATVGSASGVVNGVSAGTSVISYTLPTGCAITANVTVNPLPAAIAGGGVVCTGSTMALTNATGGGLWSSSNTTEATVGSTTGIVTGVAAGTPTISYTLPTGCIATTVITVNTTPVAITGTTNTCVGTSTLLLDATSGGTWTSNNTATATVGSSTGIVTGVLAGTVTISYTVAGCSASTAFTVNPNPSAIAGVFKVCQGQTVTLTDPTTTGVWSSSNSSVATIGSTTGVVSGILGGTVTITYTLPTGCFATAPFTVNPAPSAISGSGAVCVGLSNVLTDAISGGTWSSSNATIATVGASTGIMSGVTAGNATITYTLPAGCLVTLPITVNPNPSAVTGAATVCVGLTTTMTDATTGGTWSTSNTAVGSISATGVVTGISAGVINVTYTLGTGCIAIKAMTVNPLPAAITGPTSVCEGSTITLSDFTSGGLWSSSNTAQATVVSGTGVVTGVLASTPTITYTLPTGCIATAPITVNPTPVAITGVSTLCTGASSIFTDATSGGTWSSSNLLIATVGSSSGVVTAVLAGNVNISYSLPTGCAAIRPMTINTQPAPISGVSSICFGSTTTLTDATAGGVWTSSATTVATIGSASGVVTTVTPGTVTFTYTMPGGCTSTLAFTVNPQPAAVTGPGAVCVLASMTLSDASTGGTWTSSNSALATVGSASGIVTGVSAGPVTISYTLPGGCFSVQTITVNPLPNAITGTAVVCVNSTTTLINTTGGGTWSSSNIGLATVVSSTGVVTGVSAGNPVFTYTIPTGCFVTKIGTINPLPAAFNVTGGGNYCAGGTGVTVGLSGSVVGFSYQLFNGATAVGSPVAGTGSALSYGLQTSAGVYTVVAINNTTLCSVLMNASATVVINPLPTVFNVTGGGSYCSGLSGVAIGLNNSTTGVSYQLYLGGVASGAPVNGTTGSAITFGLRTTAGSYNVVATDIVTGCVNNMSGIASITINPLPTLYTVTGGGAYCTGSGGAAIGLSNSDIGTSYQLLIGGVPTGAPVAGTGSAISFGLQTTAGTYTVTATIISTGCINTMSGSTVISINPLPNVLAIAGGGSYCVGGTGVGVTLSATAQSGVNYQLMYGGTAIGSPIAGTGVGGINFGLQTGVGSYTAIATSTSTTCTVNMSGTATVTTNPLPTVYTLSGGGAYCAGGTGVSIFLSSSGLGVNYTVLLGGVPLVTLPGTGGPLTGVVTSAGTYTVRAQNGSGCTSIMTGSAIVSISPLPTVYTVTGTGSYCAGGAGVHVLLSSSDPGISYQLKLAGSNVGLPLAGTGSGLDFGFQTAAGTYTVVATNATTLCTNNMAGSAVITINPLPALNNVTGGGSYCTGGTGVIVGIDGSVSGISYQLLNGGLPVLAPITGTGSAFNFGSITVPGVYTILATNTTTGCTNTMSGSATVVVNPLPATYTMTGGGSYCTGGAGITMGLAGSTTGVSYQMYNGGVAAGAPVAGTGFPISFGTWTTAGTYTVKATDAITGCVSTMIGSAVITVLPLPAVFNVTGGGSYCAGGSGVHVGLSNSAVGITYQLLVGGVPVGAPMVGSGSALDFGFITVAGNYTVVATNATTGCTSNMAGSATVSINALPLVYTVSGGGNYCIGGSGVFVGLSGSNAGITYNLYNGGSPVGGPVAGTGAAISFGLQTAAGAYTVVAVDNITGCSQTMTGSASVVINPLPAAYVVTGGGSYCAGGIGTVVGLSNSQAGVNYELFVGTTSTGIILPGTGGALDFGMQLAAGSYTVVATNASTGCVSNMTGSVPVSVNPLPATFTVTGGGAYCASGTGVNIGLSSSVSGDNYQLYLGSTAIGIPQLGTGSNLDFGTFSTAGIYYVVATTAVTGCSDTMTGTAPITINPLPVAYSVTGGGSYCTGGAGLHVGLSVSDMGINYQLYRGTTPVGVPVAGSGLALDFGIQMLPGVYTVEATDALTGCVNNMTGSVTIVINTLPTTFNVTGGGSYCAGGTGYHIGIDGSSFGVNYQLYRDGIATGTPHAGTGSPIDFGILSVAGVYTVDATNPSTGCVGNMAGSATITINPLPLVYTVTGGGSYCPGGTGVGVGLSGSNSGVNYKLYRGTTLVSTVAGNDSTINFGLQTVAGSYTVVAVNAASGCSSNMTGTAVVAINALPTVFTTTGGGSYCAGGLGVHVTLSGSSAGVNYQLYRGGLPVGGLIPGTGLALDMGVQFFAGSYTVVATNASTGCTANMAGTSIVAINALPTVYTLSGGGSFCAGGTGLNVELRGSTTGIQYQLYRGSVAVGVPMMGTGSALTFGPFTTAGTYTVKATDPVSGCSSNMTGSIAISVNPLPATFSVFGGGSYCAGDAGVLVSMSGSESGIVYQLYVDGMPTGSPVIGSGTAINFGLQITAGVYTVVATNSVTTCTKNMLGSATVVINPLPTVYSVTGGGSYCDGGTGVHVGLSGSTPGVSYQLRIGVASVGAPLIGTGGLLDFGLITVGATYNVLATNVATGCVNNMSGTVAVGVNPLPVPQVITGGGNYCSGGTGVGVGLSSSEIGVDYQLYVGGVATGSPVSGSSLSISFGLQTAAGTYTVVATNTSTGCTSSMPGSALVAITPTVVPGVTINTGVGDTVCAGTSLTYTALTVNGGVSPSYQWRVDGSLLGSGSTFVYTPANGEVVTVKLTSSATCAIPNTAYDTVIMVVRNNETPVAMISALPGDTVCHGTIVNFTATSSFGGTTPVYNWYLNGSPVGIASSTYSYIPSNNDVLFVNMSSNYPCLLATSAVSNNISMKVESNVSPTVTISANYGVTSGGVVYNDTFTAYVVNGGFNPAYQWSVNNVPVVGATSSVFLQNNVNVNDVVSCYVVNTNRCGVFAGSSNLIVSGAGNVSVKTVTAAFGDIRLVPNPNNGIFTLSGSLGTTVDEEATVEVTNMLGQVVYTARFNTRNGEINEKISLSSNLVNGMYLVNLKAADGGKVFHMVIEK